MAIEPPDEPDLTARLAHSDRCGGSYNDQLVVRMHSYAHERFDAALFDKQ